MVFFPILKYILGVLFCLNYWFPKKKMLKFFKWYRYPNREQDIFSVSLKIYNWRLQLDSQQNNSHFSRFRHNPEAPLRLSDCLWMQHNEEVTIHSYP